MENLLVNFLSHPHKHLSLDLFSDLFEVACTDSGTNLEEKQK